MKHIATFIASLFISLTAGAQTIKVHKTDGTVVIYPSAEVEYIEFTAAGNAQSYTACPDAKHPHMIDLGLPSGTKWACCNVGATAPEQNGNYYAWGETQPKSVYDWNTYQWGGSWNNVVNIGSDIAGTGYDAATANWGAPWQMPSQEQCRELVDKCSSTWTLQNGVNGRKFTGPNGGTIFLPAAGQRWHAEFLNVGSWGQYWSSTIFSDQYNDNAVVLFVESGDVSWTNLEGRETGISVRPVRRY